MFAESFIDYFIIYFEKNARKKKKFCRWFGEVLKFFEIIKFLIFWE